MISYTKFTFKEFRVCARAWFAFGAGYKLGERYKLGQIEMRRAQSADAEAWQLGYDLSTRRYAKAYGRANALQAANWPAEVIRDETIRNAWRVEKLDSDQDGGVDLTIFAGPRARERAIDYAAWKYGSV